MKSYTNLEQSKELVEILPKESADQTWERIAIAGANLGIPEEMEYCHNGNIPYILNSRIGIPCWSLAALLDQLEDVIYDEDGHGYQLQIIKEGVQYYLVYDGIDYAAYYDTPLFDDLVDACVDMILMLKQRNLL